MKNKFSLLIVGAFPPKNKNIYGGNVTDGELLLRFDFDKHFNLFIIDSTQISNPPPSFLVRLFYALKRIFNFSFKLFFSKQDVVLLFVADGVSVFEKGLMAWLAKFNRVPVFLFPGAGALITDVKKSKIYGFFVYIFMRGATNILCQGPGWQIFSTEFLKFNLLNTHIVYNWTATPELLEIGKKRIFYKSEKSLKILFLARLEKEKGIFELLKACQSLSYNFKFNLIIAGRGSAEAEAKDFVNKNQLNSYVEFIGWVHGPDKIKIFENSDILVLPSWNEGFPNVIIEAMAAKLTVITT
jgi:glycosyltransferase involved in cell wall biosynthesis